MIRKEESRFKEFPSEQVVDWLGHPVTQFLVDSAKKEVDSWVQVAMQVCDNAMKYNTPEELRSAAVGVSVHKQSAAKILGFVEEAEEYVKA